ncbi:MAG: ABC transporter permease [Cumulibacter sp.]
MTVDQSVSTERRDRKRVADLDQGVLVGGLVIVLAVALAIFVDRFATSGNLVSIALTVSGLGVLALGQAVVVIGRGLDLSIIAIYGVTAQLIAKMMSDGSPEILAIIVAILAALAMGAINGLLVAYVEIPAIFVTLATSLLYLGAMRLFVFDGSVSFSFSDEASIVSFIGQSRVLGIPVSTILWVVLAAVCLWFAVKTVVGRWIYAMGDNPAAAALTGAPTRRLTVLTYVVSAFMGLIAGLIITGGAGTFDTRALSTGSQLYDVLAIVVIGGVSFAGGRGSIAGVVAATLFIGLIVNGMTLLNFDTVQQSIAKSIIILAALVVDRWLHPPNEETARVGEL